MIDHMGIHAADIARSRAFCDAALGAPGGAVRMDVPLEVTGGAILLGYGCEGPCFWPQQGDMRGYVQHIAFAARNRAEVAAFHAAALAAGGRDNGGPGLRPHYHASYYGAFVPDPDGNNIEAVCQLPE